MMDNIGPKVVKNYRARAIIYIIEIGLLYYTDFSGCLDLNPNIQAVAPSSVLNVYIDLAYLHAIIIVY